MDSFALNLWWNLNMLREALRGGRRVNLESGETGPFDSRFLRGVTGLSLGWDCANARTCKVFPIIA